LVAACIGLAACASAPKHEKPVDVVNEPPPPRPSSQVLFYPTQGQTPDQQSRDRYECYTWAAKQTGFDPSQAQLAPHQRIEVVPAQKPGSDTATGAITGALLGAAVAGPYDAAAGAFVGAMAGAMMGAASDSSRQHEAARLQRHYDVQDAQHQANLEAQASNYRRAMTACLEGRGYTVK
jgi:outer membrane lipoprotein SlyB